MTLVLTWACRSSVLQVTDRLLSKQTGEPFDCYANKNIIYLCKDALVTIGYTGDAYIKAMPTDVWMAEVLSGLDLGNVKFSFRFAKIPKQFHFKEAFEDLSRNLQRVLANHTRKFEVTVAGWKWGKSPRHQRRAAPIVTTITFTPGSGMKVSGLPRHWHYRKITLAGSPEENISQSMIRKIASDMKEAKTVDAEERVLVDAVRTVAKTNSFVGQDCMSICIAPPHFARFARARFTPLSVAQGVLIPSNRVVPVAFSPWVITPGSLMKPSVMVGSCDNVCSGWTIRVEAPEKAGLIAAWSSQDRPKA